MEPNADAYLSIKDEQAIHKSKNMTIVSVCLIRPDSDNYEGHHFIFINSREGIESFNISKVFLIFFLKQVLLVSQQI